MLTARSFAFLVSQTVIPPPREAGRCCSDGVHRRVRLPIEAEPKEYVAACPPLCPEPRFAAGTRPQTTRLSGFPFAGGNGFRRVSPEHRRSGEAWKASARRIPNLRAG